MNITRKTVEGFALLLCFGFWVATNFYRSDMPWVLNVLWCLSLFLSVLAYYLSCRSELRLDALIKAEEIGEMPLDEPNDQDLINKYCDGVFKIEQVELSPDEEEVYQAARNKNKHLLGQLVIEPGGFELAILVGIIRDECEVVSFVYRRKSDVRNMPIYEPIELNLPTSDYNYDGKPVTAVECFFENCYRLK